MWFMVAIWWFRSGGIGARHRNIEVLPYIVSFFQPVIASIFWGNFDHMNAFHIIHGGESFIYRRSELLD